MCIYAICTMCMVCLCVCGVGVVCIILGAQRENLCTKIKSVYFKK